MNPKQDFIEPRSFRSRADDALEHSLEAKYRRIAIPELAEIVQQQQQGSAGTDDKQLR